MAFTPIDSITINGSPKAFGGYVFDVSYDVSLEASPSKLILNFISEDGKYLEPQLSAKTPYRIDVGHTINENFYAVSYTEKKTTSSKVLEVMFYDGSVILDNIWVGRHKMHGTNPNAKKHITTLEGLVPNPYPEEIFQAEGASDNLIIVGSERHPCDENEDGVFDQKDIGLLTYSSYDPCSMRCPSDTIDSNPIINDCLTRAKTQIFRVDYTFTELLTEVAKKVKIVKRPELKDDTYRADTTGPLREVLSNWCRELGLTYYWENDGLNFVDISKRPKISIPTFDCVQSSSHTKTLEGTFKKGCISHYASEGQILDRDCSDARKISLHCLTLKDLYGTAWVPKYGAGGTGSLDESLPPASGEDEYKDGIYPTGIPVQKLEEAAVCANYDSRLRFLYVLRNYYGIQNAKNAVDKKGVILDRLGSMKILKVFDRDASDTASADAYSGYNDLLKGDVLKPDERQNVQDYKGFFIVASVNMDKLESQIDFEKRLARDFMGKHWIRGYHSPFYGEEPGLTSGCQYIGDDISELKEAEFTKFFHDNDSRVGKLGKDLKKPFKPVPLSGVVAGNLNSTALDSRKQVDNNRKCLLYYPAPVTSWVPNINGVTDNYFKAMLDSVEESIPKRCTNTSSDLFKALLQQEIIDNPKLNSDIDKGRVQLFVVFPGEFSMSSNFGNNIEEKDPAEAPVGRVLNTNYGLSSKRCVIYNVFGTAISTPAGASCRFDSSGDSPLLDPRNAAMTSSLDLSKPINSGAPHFGVLVSPTRSAHVEIPKVEAVLVTAPPAGDALVTDYHFMEQIPPEAIKLLSTLQNQCIPDYSKLQEIHKKFNELLTYSILEPFESYEFTVAGIDLPSGKISISTGLEGFSIRIDDKGVTSTYRIGNTKFSPVQENVLLKRLVLELKNAIARRARSPFSSAQAPTKPIQP